MLTGDGSETPGYQPSGDEQADIASGACVFEYADERWKDTASGDPFTQNYGPRWVGPFADAQGNEEGWGIFRTVDNGSNVDLLEPRALFFRLAAMWNDPFQRQVHGSPDLRMSCSNPVQLIDQDLRIEFSTKLVDWVTVAEKQWSACLRPTVAFLCITNTEVGDAVQVILAQGACDDAESPNLL